MSHRVCPWWLGYFLISPFRRWRQDPSIIVNGFVREGMTVLEPGPGMGFFTLDLLRAVGPAGRVVAVDIQPKMLARLQRRASKVRLGGRLDARLASSQSMPLEDLRGAVDFTLAFAVVHEFPDAPDFFRQVAAASKPGASVMLAEPSGHVKDPEFESELTAASEFGFHLQSHPLIRGYHAAVLVKS
ncbi:MAG TPA: class I SAM-dependent methyltransferase [Candidatus Sulfotelmatobacter sp.]|nr:class I SAM-dependent methyltransferase [Candidatus Sulfotelmatobacter sp.]